MASAFSPLQYAVWVEVHGEDLASHGSVVEKGESFNSPFR